MINLNPQTFRRLWRLVKPFFFGDEKWKARALLLLLAFFALSIAGVNVRLSYLGRDFFNAIALRQRDEFFRALAYYLLGFALATPITVFYGYTEQRLALEWRKWLSREILGKYFGGLAYYKVSSYEGIDNPDQRIEEDIRTFTAQSLSLFLIVVNSCLTLILFIGILWSISINLIIAVVLYALVGSLITYFVGRPLISLNFNQLKKEANYRYKLVNVRDNAESIAFYRADRKELTRTRQRLKGALDNFKKIVNLNRNLNLFITFYNNVKPVVPVVVVSGLFFAGEIELGVVTQSTDAFIRVVEALSILIQNFAMISSVTAVVTRLGSFSEALENASHGKLSATSDGDDPARKIRITEGKIIAFRSVTIFPPAQSRVLLEDLSFELLRGGLLITGPSGCGKSSVLRVIAGLWTSGSGEVIRPPLTEAVFIPQRPYMVLGTFRSQFLYSLGRRVATDREIIAAVEAVGLETTFERVGGLDAEVDWNSFLSTGEQQRLAFARLILARPKYAFLDEATTAVDSATEEQLYHLLTKVTKAFVSIGHRSPLAQYHHSILELRGGKKWRMEDRQ